MRTGAYLSCDFPSLLYIWTFVEFEAVSFANGITHLSLSLNRSFFWKLLNICARHRSLFFTFFSSNLCTHSQVLSLFTNKKNQFHEIKVRKWERKKTTSQQIGFVGSYYEIASDAFIVSTNRRAGLYVAIWLDARLEHKYCRISLVLRKCDEFTIRTNGSRCCGCFFFSLSPV